jgi:hypothetical protein
VSTWSCSRTLINVTASLTKDRTKKEYAVSYLKFIEPSKYGAVEA